MDRGRDGLERERGEYSWGRPAGQIRGKMGPVVRRVVGPVGLGRSREGRVYLDRPAGRGRGKGGTVGKGYGTGCVAVGLGDGWGSARRVVRSWVLGG